jgi:EcoRII C terminal
LQEGQFREMTEARVRLVVPAPLVSAYPGAVQPHLQTLESFMGDIRLLNVWNWKGQSGLIADLKGSKHWNKQFLRRRLACFLRFCLIITHMTVWMACSWRRSHLKKSRLAASRARSPHGFGRLMRNAQIRALSWDLCLEILWTGSHFLPPALGLV